MYKSCLNDSEHKPCLKGCQAYDEKLDQCSILRDAQATSRDILDSPEEKDIKLVLRGKNLEKLLTKSDVYPCAFYELISHWAAKLSNVRGLNSQDRDDIISNVALSLMKLGAWRINPTYEDFRRYLIATIHNEVTDKYSQEFGECACGTCVFFSEGGGKGSERCGCPDLQPPPDREYVFVSRGQKRADVKHYSMFFIALDDILNWPSFLSKLRADWSSQTANPSRRILEMLSRELREALLNTSQNNGLQKSLKLSLIETLNNNILQRHDFYQKDYFSDLKITDEKAIELLELEQSEKGLSDLEVRRLNRLLLEEYYVEVVRSQSGCSYYKKRVQFIDLHCDKMKFVGLDDLVLLYLPNECARNKALKKMEYLGERQRNMVVLLRLLIEGCSTAEIGEKTGKHEKSIPRLLYGTTENKGKENEFHQAGALDILRAIYRDKIDGLKREKKELWSVVHARDFSSDKIQPRFDEIGREFHISKRDAIRRYIEGWDWMHGDKGGSDMPKTEADKSGPPPEGQPDGQLHEVSAMLHPDFHVLLGYAEGAFDREANRLIAGHVVICDYCSSRLQYIELEILSDDPCSVAQLVGGINEASDFCSTADEITQTKRPVRTPSVEQELKSKIEELNGAWRMGMYPDYLRERTQTIEELVKERGTSVESRLHALSSAAMVRYALGDLIGGHSLGKRNWETAKAAEPDSESQMKWMAMYGYFYPKMFLGLVKPSMKLMAQQWSSSYATLSEGKKKEMRELLANKLPLNPVLSIPRHICLAAAFSDGPLFDKEYWPSEKAFHSFKPNRADREVAWLDAWYQEAQAICTSEPLSLNLSHAYAGFYLTLLLPQRMQDTNLHDRIQKAFSSINDSSPVAQYVKYGFSGVYRLVCSDYKGALDSLNQAAHFSTTSGNRFAESVFNCSYAVAAAHCSQSHLEPYISISLRVVSLLANNTTKGSLYQQLYEGTDSIVSELRGDEVKAQSTRELSRPESIGRRFLDSLMLGKLCPENL